MATEVYNSVFHSFQVSIIHLLQTCVKHYSFNQLTSPYRQIEIGIRRSTIAVKTRKHHDLRRFLAAEKAFL